MCIHNVKINNKNYNYIYIFIYTSNLIKSLLQIITNYYKFRGYEKILIDFIVG